MLNPGDEGGGSGSGGPNLEKRVTKLETDMTKIFGVLDRLEPKISEILLTGAKQADLHKTQLDVAEMKGRMAAIEDKFSGLEARIGLLPSTWTILGIVFTTWGVGSGIVFAITNF